MIGVIKGRETVGKKGRRRIVKATSDNVIT